MRAKVIATAATAALFVLIAGPGQVSAQGIGGLVKKAGQAAKNANDKKDKGPDKPADKPSEQPATRCDVSDDAYDRLLKGMQAELDGLKQLAADFAKAKAGSNTYKQCQMTYGMTEEYQKIMNQAPPSQTPTPEQLMKWMTDKSTAADNAMAKKCGTDPILSWTAGDLARMREEIAKNAAKTAGMDDQCYANLKEFAEFFCGLPEATQQKATQEGLKIPGTGRDIYWVFTPEHARALEPRCSKLTSAIASVERAVPK